MTDRHMLVTSPCLQPQLINHLLTCSPTCGVFESQPSFCVLFLLGMAVICLIGKKTHICLLMKTKFSARTYCVKWFLKEKKNLPCMACCWFLPEECFQWCGCVFDAGDRGPESFSHNIRGDNAKLYHKSSDWQTGEKIHRIFQRFYYGRLPCAPFIKPHGKGIELFNLVQKSTVCIFVTHCDVSLVPLRQQSETWSMKICLTAVGKTYAADKLELKQLGVQLEVITKYFYQERHIPVLTRFSSN